MEENDKGKAVPKKLGLAPIQRDDAEYEFDVTLYLDSDNMPSIVKDTTYLGSKGSELKYKLSPEFGENLVEWLEQGADPKEFEEKRRVKLVEQVKSMAKENSSLKALFKHRHPDKKANDLTMEQTEAMLEEFNAI